ncbi:hypothetical protein D1871_01600 [Nakamurella silvestris]|nr:hypothetical protein D1871_01600 [Nakamurella silvestris]
MSENNLPTGQWPGPPPTPTRRRPGRYLAAGLVAAVVIGGVVSLPYGKADGASPQVTVNFTPFGAPFAGLLAEKDNTPPPPVDHFFDSIFELMTRHTRGYYGGSAYGPTGAISFYVRRSEWPAGLARQIDREVESARAAGVTVELIELRYTDRELRPLLKQLAITAKAAGIRLVIETTEGNSVRLISPAAGDPFAESQLREIATEILGTGIDIEITSY